MVAVQACNRQSAVCVPLHDGLALPQLAAVLGHCRPAAVFASAACLPRLLAALKSLGEGGGCADAPAAADTAAAPASAVAAAPDSEAHALQEDESITDNADACAASSSADAAADAGTAAQLAATAAVAVRAPRAWPHAVVYWGHAHPSAPAAACELGMRLLSLAELEDAGRRAPVAPVAPEPRDSCTLVYTAGTSGDPKGVMLTHSAVVAAVASARAGLTRHGIQLGPGDSMLSHVALAHAHARVYEEVMLHGGGAIGYWQGDQRALLDDLRSLSPTLLVSNPSGLGRVHRHIQTEYQASGHAYGAVPYVSRWLFHAAFKAKSALLARGWGSSSVAARTCDVLALRSASTSALGGNGSRLKGVVACGGPLPSHVEAFLATVTAAPVVQCYGLTETAGIASMGAPAACVEIRLESIPELCCDAVDAADPRGELLLRGPAMFSGYHNDDATTSAALDSGGWLRTGDMCSLSPKDGRLSVLGRRADMVRLPSGDCVSVESVELAIAACPLVRQVWVYGTPFQPGLVAVIVPARDPLMTWMMAKKMTSALTARIYDICQDAAVVAHVRGALGAAGAAAKLRPCEGIKAFHLEPEPFSSDNGLATASGGLRRAQLKAKYGDTLNAMFRGLQK
ncbi:hypothetical protein FOA52_016007 [Chlamydomonas sp. UWO 241]|nr:hypothetical protein FOA52_016007 [Chlamydomonas sp. UWO 241]